MLRLDLAAQVDQGLVRRTNQDLSRVVPELGVALVADGMGGHEHGEIASDVAAGAFQRCFEKLGGVGGDVAETTRRIVVSFREANLAVGAHPGAEGAAGMGTTLTVAAFAHHGVVVGHVGDSRCYRLRAGSLAQLTEDHSYAAVLRQRAMDAGTPLSSVDPKYESVLTRCINGVVELPVDVRADRMEVGDVVLLCSDGLWGSVSEETLTTVLSTAPSATEACERLIRAACSAGGADNIAVAVVRLL